jgi:DNA (cytosine-5)-methyltransferase 1
VVDFHPKPQTKPTPFMPHKESGDARILSPEKWKQIKEHKARHKAQGHGLGYQLHIHGKPMYTVTKEALLNNHNLIQWGNTARHLSTGELLEVGSFPRDFVLAGTYEDAFNRIGNSVPPRFIQAIATYVYETFLRGIPMLDFVDKPLKLDGVPKFTVVSTFSGAGGSSLGYVWSGGKVLAAVEWDDNAVATYKLNFPDTPILHRDIKTVTVEELLVLTGLHPGELDILDGSPPCQGLSTAGKRQFDDPRNSLFKEFVRLLRGLQPKVFVMENVSGMVKGDMKHIFAIVMRELKASGYQVKCQLMNAMYFGVPQSRERVIFIGVRNDLCEDLGILPSHPESQVKPITVSQAFENVQDDGTGDRVKPTTKIYQAMKSVKPGDTQPGHYSHTRLQLSKPSCTLKRAGGLGHYHFWHPTEHRVITLNECKRLATFPDAFQFVGKINEAWDRIGNSVPPRFMMSIASHIYENILKKVNA